jgi:hypothetical protein
LFAFVGVFLPVLLIGRGDVLDKGSIACIVNAVGCRKTYVRNLLAEIHGFDAYFRIEADGRKTRARCSNGISEHRVNICRSTYLPCWHPKLIDLGMGIRVAEVSHT